MECLRTSLWASSWYAAPAYLGNPHTYAVGARWPLLDRLKSFQSHFPGLLSRRAEVSEAPLNPGCHQGQVAVRSGCGPLCLCRALD